MAEVLAGIEDPDRLAEAGDLGSVTRVPRTAAGEPGRPLVGSVRDIEPLSVELVREPAEPAVPEALALPPPS